MRRSSTLVIALSSALVVSAAEGAGRPTAEPAARAAPPPTASSTAPAGLQRARPRHRVHYISLTGLQWNPPGLETRLLVDYRYLLYRSDSLALADNFVGIGGTVRVNPAFTRLGVAIELQPLTLLTVRATYEWRGYYGVVRNLQSFSSARADYSPNALAARSSAGVNYAGSGHQFRLQALLRAKFGPVALIGELELWHFRMNLRGGDAVFYDASVDTLLPDGGFTVVHHTNLLYVTGFGLMVGARYSLVDVFYPKRAYAVAISRGNANTPTHRIGPLFAYVFDAFGERVRQPTIFASVSWWFGSRYRSGKSVSQAVPYGVIAFRFSGDFWRR